MKNLKIFGNARPLEIMITSISVQENPAFFQKMLVDIMLDLLISFRPTFYFTFFEKILRRW